MPCESYLRDSVSILQVKVPGHVTVLVLSAIEGMVYGGHLIWSRKLAWVPQTSGGHSKVRHVDGDPCHVRCIGVVLNDDNV